MTPFYTILTNYGKTVLAEALAAQQPLKIPHMAVGDGSGGYYEPTEAQTNLRNERWRGDLNDLRTDDELQGQVIAEAIIPHDIEDGDWTAREIGLFDAKGGLVAVGKYPETYIPSALSGAKTQVYINIIIKIDNVAAVQLTVNHGQVLASKLFVKERGYGVVGSFSQGLYQLSELSNSKQLVLFEQDETLYYWSGPFPKSISIGATPETSGGVGEGKWRSISGLSQSMREAIGVVVSSGDDLLHALSHSSPNQTLTINGDVVLDEGISVPHAINFKRVNNGRILWNGSGDMIRIIPPVVATITLPVEFKQGDSIATLPDNHGIKDGMMLCAFSNERRTGQSIGDYYRGQYFFVRKVAGNSIEFYPSPIEGFTSNKIEARYPTENMRHDIVIKHIAPTGNAGGVIFDMPYSLNCSGNIVIEGNRDPNVGIGVGGHNHEFNVSVQGITHGADGYNVLGYGVTCTGTQITINGSARNCRHAFEVPSRDIISGSITFNMEITKEKGNPLYLYIGGVHCNVVDWKFRGRVSGSGMLIMDRSGTGDIKCHFDGQDDGFEYAHVSVTDIYPRTTRIHGCTMSDDGRKCLVDWDIKGQPAANGMLKISGNVLKGRKRIIRFRDSSAATSHTYRVRVNDNTGQAVSIHNLDLNDSNVYLELSDNTLSSSGLPAFPDFMAGTGVSNNVNYDLRSSNNNIDDSATLGMYSFNGRIGGLSVSSENDKNTTLPFFNMKPEYLGTLKVFNVLSLDTAGQSKLTPTATTRYEDVGMISFCRIRHDSATPFISEITWPIIYTGNRFNTTFDVTLTSSKRPQGGNVNLGGKSIIWNGQNVAV